MQNPNNYSFIILALFTFSLGLCATIYDKSKMSLVDVPFDKRHITFKTDGYYYLEVVYDVGEDKSLEMQYGQRRICAVMPIVFYDDGYVRKSEFIHGITPFNKLDHKNDCLAASIQALEESIENENFHVDIANTIWNWGIYRQRNDTVFMQYYYNHYGDYKLIKCKGKVINDTTIVLFEKKGYSPLPNRIINSIKEKGKEIYYFREFSHKPDSNNYIKSNINKFGRN